MAITPTCGLGNFAGSGRYSAPLVALGENCTNCGGGAAANAGAAIASAPARASVTLSMGCSSAVNDVRLVLCTEISLSLSISASEPFGIKIKSPLDRIAPVGVCLRLRRDRGINERRTRQTRRAAVHRAFFKRDRFIARNCIVIENFVRSHEVVPRIGNNDQRYGNSLGVADRGCVG